MKKIVLAALAAAVLSACSSPPPPPPPPAVPEPPPKVLLTITAKSPEAVTAVNAAMDLMANVRQTEASAQIDKALAADPDCALAHALLGSMTPGVAGMEHLTKAETLAATASPAEKAYVLSLAADRRGEDQISLDALKTATAAANDDWRMHFALGQAYFGSADFANAGTELAAAAAINPAAGPVQNTLGYLAMRQGKPDEAIAAFTKYTELSPNEANAQDSLAEALMSAGKLDESEAGFQKALALDPTFFPAWAGIAQVRFLKSDWTGGREALAKERETATRDQDKVASDMALAWSYLAEGKSADAMKTIDGVETMAKDKSLDVTYAFAPLSRAEFLTLTGKAAKALPLCDEATKRATAATLPGGPMGNLTRMSLLTQVEAYSALGKAKEAADALAKFEAEIAKIAGTPDRVSQLAYARGISAMAAKDYKAAAEQFATCSSDDLMAKLHHARALKLGGDEAGSGSAAQSLLAVQHRDPAWLWIASEAKKLAPVAAPAGT